MCGIAGFYNHAALLGSKAQALGLLSKMLLTILHRGPDADGAWIDANNRCALGHRRLSIIDTSDAGRQPMASIDQRWWISFNGEIYNFQELRGRLAAVGIHPRGRTDTEVLILGLQHWGTDFLPWIDGMFAFAAFDTATGELLLARDAFGEKPLYYTELAAGALAFASELQALEVLPGFDDEVSLDAMAEVLMFQYIGSPRSIYREVHKLLPGQWMKVTPAGKTFGSHFRFSPAPEEGHNRNADDLADELEELLVTSLRRRLIADVPLGAFLSGGVDSSTVCALIRRRLGVPLKTFSMGFEGSGESEHETARAFADHLGTEHYEKILTPDASTFLKTVGSLLDEPNGDSSCLPTYLLSEFARQHVTVAISGDGGDELFAGYGRFMSTIQEFGSDPAPGARVGDAYYSDRILVAPDGLIQTLFGELPPSLARHLHGLRTGLDRDGRPLHARLRQTDLENYMPGAVLPKMDRMSMRHSLEVRTPFLNRELAGFAERLGENALYSGAVGKQLLRRVACRHLPAELVKMPKRGFAIPTSQWAPDELWELTRQMLFSDDSRLLQVFGAGRIEAFVGPKDQFSGRAVYRVWGLVMLESWCRHHPVTLPRLSAEVRRKGASMEAAGATTLFARQVAPQAYAAVVMSAQDAGQAAKALERALPHGDLLCLALSRATPRPGLTDGQIIDASVRSLPLPAEGPGPGWLRQASLMLVDGASLPKLGASELQALQASGVREILSLDPYRSDGQVIRLSIRPPKWGLAAWRHRRKQRRATVARHALESLRSPASGHTFELSLPEHEANEDARGSQSNLFARYAVRVGPVQLPPLPVRNDVMASRGDGRYHVFGRSVTFALPRAAARDDDVCVTRADAAADEFHAEEIAAPLGDDRATVLPAPSGATPASSVIPLPGKGGTVVFMATVLEQDLARLAEIPRIAGPNRGTPITVLTVTPLAREMVAKLPVGMAHCVLDRTPLDDWLGFVPDLPAYRSALWPQWSEYGQVPALLLGQIRKRSPQQLIVVGESAHSYLRPLQAAGCLPMVR
jgi:asparagine synthase (glutamine-hydrolysing)